MFLIQIAVLFALISGFYASICDFDVKLAQSLLNEGFHRNLTYKVRFSEKDGFSREYDDCYIGLNQALPSGLYAYPDELLDLQRTNKLTAISKNRVNVELPAEESQPTSVFIIGKVKRGKASLWLPVHARYHRAVKGGGFFQNEIETPEVYLRCPHVQINHCEPRTVLNTYPCNGDGLETCNWRHIPYKPVSPSPLKFPMPVGDTVHVAPVSAITMVFVIMGSLYVLRTLHDYIMDNYDNEPVCKHSARYSL